MSSLLNKLKSASKVKLATSLDDSTIFNDKEIISTPIPALNLILSGEVAGGISSGVTFLAAPPAHFKSLLGLFMVSSYMKHHKDAVCIFYDSEFGIPKATFESFGMDSSRILHIPIENIEVLKMDIVQQLEAIERGKDKVIIFVDSIGMLPSKKEATDALDGKSVADMTRAKEMKSLFRLISASLIIKDVPMVVINQVYKTLELYSKQIMSGGEGARYAGNTVIYITKAQEKDGDELAGYNFTLINDKSRFVREKSKIPLTVTYERGIEKCSGLFALALEFGWIQSPNKGWYQVVDKRTGEILPDKYRKAELASDNKLFLQLFEWGFAKELEDHYKLGGHAIYTDDLNEVVYSDAAHIDEE